MWKQMENQTLAANSYEDYIQDVVKEPYLIGYHRCQYIDRYNQKKKLLKQGMVKDDGTTYEPYTKIVTAANKAIKVVFDESRHH
jgi:ABC-type phosphate transport system substrate-binding protein